MQEFICDYNGNEIKVKLDLSKISVIMKYIISEDEIPEVSIRKMIGNRLIVWIITAVAITAVVIELPTI